MKPLSKPLSSPGRPYKFPPPLMRFLRSNVSSRSRGRSRSSPIFYLRSKKRLSGGVIETTQEPSSPKVTCIGQVRVRRKKNTPAASNRRRRRRCLWLNKTLFRCRFPKRLFGRIFRMWKLIFRSNCCRGVEEGDNHNSRVVSDRKSEEIENHAVAAGDINNINNNKFRNSVSSNESETEFYRSNKDEEISGDVIGNSKSEFIVSSSSSSPPKNALLLTRCRSAPYRSSSLAGRFWGEEKLGEIDGEKSPEGSEKPKCEENVDGDEENSREMEKKIEELKVKNRGIAVHPLLLTRCKSEPARKGERFANFLMQRLEDDISSST
ncbi:hypothetical protein CASFOL_027591 [Castilleja foliolosa]|uniref:Uncharacterized protein n=1 Tax=Castilleja foliolosa TaxID=1961234 RepID=A0ABD3CF93_9LAMI